MPYKDKRKRAEWQKADRIARRERGQCSMCHRKTSRTSDRCPMHREEKNARLRARRVTEKPAP